MLLAPHLDVVKPTGCISMIIFGIYHVASKLAMTRYIFVMSEATMCGNSCYTDC